MKSNKKNSVQAGPVSQLVWDNKRQSVRGSFVNLILTFTILGLIVAGITDDAIMERVEKLSTLILGFFATSLGIWSYKKIAEKKTEGGE